MYNNRTTKINWKKIYLINDETNKFNPYKNDKNTLRKWKN